MTSSFIIAVCLTILSIILFFRNIVFKNYEGVSALKKLIFIILIVITLAQAMNVVFIYSQSRSSYAKINELQQSNLTNKEDLIKVEKQYVTHAEDDAAYSSILGGSFFLLSIIVIVSIKKESEKAYDEPKEKWDHTKIGK